MSYRARIIGNFDEFLETSSLEWTISSKSNSFHPVKFRLDKYHPKAPNGYHVTVSVDKPENPSEPSSSSSSSSIKSIWSSESSGSSEASVNKETSIPKHQLLPEISFTSSELIDIASIWSESESGRSDETTLTVPPATKPIGNENYPDEEAISNKEKAQTKGKGKGKGKVQDEDKLPLPLPPDGAIGDSLLLNLQPHYKSLLDDF